MVLRMKNFKIFGVHWKIRLLGGVGRGLEKPIGRGDCLKSRGFWTVCWFKGETVFEGAVDTPMPTM